MTRDAGEPPTWPVAGSGDNATAVAVAIAQSTLLFIVANAPAKVCYATSLLKQVSGRPAYLSGRSMRCEFLWAARSSTSANAGLNTYRSPDGTWFVVVATPDGYAVLKAIGREDILTDPRFSDPASWRRMTQLTAMLSGRLVRGFNVALCGLQQHVHVPLKRHDA